MPEIQKVPGGELGSGELVDGDDRHTFGRARLDRDDRDVVGQLRDRVRRDGLRCDDEDSADALGPQPLDRIEDGAAVEGQEADDADEIARSDGLRARSRRASTPGRRGWC